MTEDLQPKLVTRTGTESTAEPVEIEGLPVGLAVVVSSSGRSEHVFTDEDGDEVRHGN